MTTEFVQLCKDLNIPIAEDKTVWATTLLIFLGILLDGINMMLSIPLEKRDKALRLLNDFSDKKRATIKEIQVLTGYLNFLSKAIFAGRTFIRHMYNKASIYKIQGTKQIKLKQHHHIRLDSEFKFDCEVWRYFLDNFRTTAVCRPTVDLDMNILAPDMNFSSDASANGDLGFGAVFENDWLFGQWEENYIKMNNPSIEYLELYALVAAVLTWEKKITNLRMTVFCDNESVVHMVNSSTSSCIS